MAILLIRLMLVTSGGLLERFVALKIALPLLTGVFFFTALPGGLFWFWSPFDDPVLDAPSKRCGVVAG